MERIADRENLNEAFLRAAKAKRGRKAVVEFRRKVDDNLHVIRQQLLDGTFRFGRYQFFTIHDPKKRSICAASFPERVVFHAIMRICHPVFDNYQTYDSYACRKGKGQYKALERAQHFARRYQWFAKLDVRHYFDSISHRVLMQQLCRLFKDKQLLLYFSDLIASYSVMEGRGIPIGNLTSQYFANHYLAAADHYAKEKLGIKAMVRYMDDILLFAEEQNDLMKMMDGLKDYLHNSLRLECHEPIINKSRHGIPFLGYVVYGDNLRLNKRSKNRYHTKMKELAVSINLGEICGGDYAQHASCLTSFIAKADTYGFRNKVLNARGMYLHGL
ncbi:MAG: RNA-directed DNA polymerase [Prevotella sp.]|nr:RNA-directed DNA polymerase [Prevotella sp.]